MVPIYLGSRPFGELKPLVLSVWLYENHNTNRAPRAVREEGDGALAVGLATLVVCGVSLEYLECGSNRPLAGVCFSRAEARLYSATRCIQW